jgi:V/A-type H+-transporting ATPase subunit I
MMFGDVGHGAILCALGYYVFRKMYRYIDYGIILMECGVSSMIFGLLYGSVFGLEDLIPALWMHPMEEINHFMVMSAFLGIGVISLGLILNLINVIRQHRYGELLSTSGLAGALLYWLGVGLVARYLLSGGLSPFELIFAKVAAGALIILMILQRPVRAVLAQRRTREKWRHLPPGLGVTILESFIEVLDDLLRYLANTVSFVRVAAFAITHAGLFIAVFSLADMVQNVHGQGLFYWITIIIGNVVIIALEGIVVSIQTLRLEYYEFFSKFFRGGGKPFQPLLEEPTAYFHRKLGGIYQ